MSKRILGLANSVVTSCLYPFISENILSKLTEEKEHPQFLSVLAGEGGDADLVPPKHR